MSEPQFALDRHRLFGTEEQQRAVQVRAELNAVGLDLADRRQAEDLEAAAVRQDGRGQLMNECRPPPARMMSSPGRMLR